MSLLFVLCCSGTADLPCTGIARWAVIGYVVHVFLLQVAVLPAAQEPYATADEPRSHPPYGQSQISFGDSLNGAEGLQQAAEVEAATVPTYAQQPQVWRVREPLHRGPADGEAAAAPLPIIKRGTRGLAQVMTGPPAQMDLQTAGNCGAKIEKQPVSFATFNQCAVPSSVRWPFDWDFALHAYVGMGAVAYLVCREPRPQGNSGRGRGTSRPSARPAAALTAKRPSPSAA